MFRRLWDVLNKCRAELVVISSMPDEGNYNCFHGVKLHNKATEISPAPSKTNEEKSHK